MDPLLDTAPCGFLSFADDGAILAANATLRGWLGYGSDALIGRSIETLLPLASRIFYQTHFFPLLKIAGQVEEVYMALRTAEGAELPVLVNAARREQDGGAANDCAFMVVRQRSRYEDEILEARRNAEEARLWLATTLQSLGDAVIATDARGKVAFMNPAAEELTGWTQAEALARPLDEVFTALDEETQQPVESPYVRVMREQHVVEFSDPTLLAARNGARRPIDDSGAPIRNSAGEVLGVVLVFRDISERRHGEHALREKQDQIEALNQHLQRAMTETHHRVKNNLQVISALVDMQIETGQELLPSTEFMRLSQHIRGLAVIHDLLTHQARRGGPSERLSVQETLKRLLPLLQGMTRGKNLSFTGDDALLPLDHATSLAVLVNELVSNATKHGSGDIGIVFTVEGKTGTLEVWNEGKGFPAGFNPTTSANTGIELVETISRYDLRGEVVYQNRPAGGARVLVAFPLK